MSILDKIVAHKIKEVALQKELVSFHQLERSRLFDRPSNSLAEALKQSQSGIIAEHKRRSPSKSVINENVSIDTVAKGYEAAGVCGMSVLTDAHFFGGHLNDLLIAREHCNLPLLRKEFIIDEYQIIEAKANGADVILLIAAILEEQEIKQFSEIAKGLHLDVLLEVHNEQELAYSLMPNIDMLGVNNRNLKTFEVNTDISKTLSRHIPDEFVKVSESGIHSTETINDLRSYGFEGFLIGENFMKTNDPGKSATAFIKQLIS
ncbi:MAG: indole-3-glycerol phosphate synthase TrpC [Bacteroidia bacterium]|nr:indole-3-glycerol phosphate synthase TrpC [Bacteroidia bacterium]NND52833.1 indole-3-glycerol phosphate synthase TrpC [Flavobacteriaceae bacterium]